MISVEWSIRSWASDFCEVIHVVHDTRIIYYLLSSVNLLVFYYKYCFLIGYTTHDLYYDR